MGAMPTATGRRADVTNREVAEVLGVTHSMISRIRSGDRSPSLDLMTRIAFEFKWPLEDQGNERRLGTYRHGFEEHLSREYNRPLV